MVFVVTLSKIFVGIFIASKERLLIIGFFGTVLWVIQDLGLRRWVVKFHLL